MKEELKLVPINDIKIPEGRYRSDLGDIEALAESIEVIGQQVPIIITNDLMLIAGERRLTAHKFLVTERGNSDFTHIKAIVKHPMDDIDNRIIEIIENLERKEFTWQEQVRAVKDVHTMLLEKYPGWSGIKTAEEIGLSVGGACQDLNLAEVLETLPELFENCRTKQDAFKRLKKHLLDEAKAEIQLRASQTDYAMKAKDCVKLGNCVDLIELVPDGYFDAIISDPFYGIEISDLKKSNESKEEFYVDDLVTYKDTMETFLLKASAKLKPDAWIVLFCDITLFQYLYDLLTDCGFTPDKIPALWYRTGSPGQTRQPNYNLGRSYEVMIYARRGEAIIKRPGLSNVFPYKGVDPLTKEHPVKKPTALMVDVIQRFCHPGDRILDFMCGSGTTLVAALKTGCLPIGFELNPEHHKTAIFNVSETLKMKDAGQLDLV